VGLFDWLGRGRREDATPIVWHVLRESFEVVVEDGRGASHRLPLAGARTVRVVPLTGVQSHVVAQTRGWQVALSRPEGDVLVGSALADWRVAWDLARLLSERTEIPLDETTQKMFSRVGQYSPQQPTA
jgi:hypothetical protein